MHPLPHDLCEEVGEVLAAEPQRMADAGQRQGWAQLMPVDICENLLDSRGLARDMGGDLTLDAASGRGASFRLVLPARPTLGGSNHHRKEES